MVPSCCVDNQNLPMHAHLFWTANSQPLRSIYPHITAVRQTRRQGQAESFLWNWAMSTGRRDRVLSWDVCEEFESTSFMSLLLCQPLQLLVAPLETWEYLNRCLSTSFIHSNTTFSIIWYVVFEMTTHPPLWQQNNPWHLNSIGRGAENSMEMTCPTSKLVDSSNTYY